MYHHHAMKTCKDIGGAVPHILNIGAARWTRTANFTLQPFYLQRKSQKHPLSRANVGPQNMSEYCGEDLSLCLESNLDNTVIHLVSQLLY